MSAGVCGKRLLGFEEIFGSPAAPPPPPAKRSRCSHRYGSPIFGSDDNNNKLSLLLRMFPSMDREVVETVLNTHDHKVDDAIKSLHALCLGDHSALNESVVLNSILQSNNNGIEDSMDNSTSLPKVYDGHVGSSDSESRNMSSWEDIFVQEMMSSSDWDDVRTRARKILEDFERSVLANSKAPTEEVALLKEQLQCLFRENLILKRGVAIQHERSLEHEEKLKEVEQLKHVISQYQEQVRTLEMNNYTLKIHLQRAQEASSIPSQFHPDIF